MTTAASAQGPASAEQGRLFGHPTGLFTLFFAEMWERFSYYGMRALLIFYMTKGFLRYDDKSAYAVYGAYTALVYMTPYFGGMIADKVLGQRRAVILGGLLMAAGHLLMTIETKLAFFGALALLICGNGFFKPNISTIVGSLYNKEPAKKDAGFTIFYMGINLGAAMSPILCAYVGETYGRHYGFGLATIGMLIGLAVFVVPTRIAQLLILLGALAATGSMLKFWDDHIQLAVRIFLAITLLAAAAVSFMALNRGGLHRSAGVPATPPPMSKQLAVYGGTVVAIIGFTFLVQNKPVADVVLGVAGVIALGYIGFEAIRSTVIERHRLFVVGILMFFSLLFWAFFEQAGSSINNFTDRNIDLVDSDKKVADGDVGTTIKFRVLPANDDAEVQKLPLLSQAQLGYANGNEAERARVFGIVKEDANKALADKEKELVEAKAGDDKIAEEKKNTESFLAAVEKEPALTMSTLSVLRNVAGAKDAKAETKTVEWTVTKDNVGMELTESEIPAAEFQAANPIFIVLFGLVFSAIWSWLGARNKEPTTTVKFALGLLQLGLGFLVLFWGAKNADSRGMVAITWLLLGYLLHTTGELCISPVGLSMVTKLSPARLTSTVMGAWFLATAFSNSLSAIIAAFTSAQHDGGGFIEAPVKTVGVYGEVFKQIGLVAVGAAVLCFILSPLLTKWMHREAEGADVVTGGGGH